MNVGASKAPADFSTYALLRSSNDLPVLGTLLAALQSSGADYLITGDKDLPVLADSYPIVTPARFWEMHAGV